MAALRGSWPLVPPLRSWPRCAARGRIRTGRGRGGRDPCRLCTAPVPELGESCPCTGRSAELRHTTGRRQAGRRAAPALAGRRGTCGVHMAARRGRKRARASTRQGGRHEPGQQGTQLAPGELADELCARHPLVSPPRPPWASAPRGEVLADLRAKRPSGVGRGWLGRVARVVGASRGRDLGSKHARPASGTVGMKDPHSCPSTLVRFFFSSSLRFLPPKQKKFSRS